ncbi:2-oxo-4-hydroxy-4-carboxy-5-ureidoimidazoline decarboxylase [Nocardia otitidiscaviarum]|uniref:2-oxo-4-hydroxy-4-carboxy-5-ureidoimidazoline decarboxylase n=1 Tax=Nocardia otitidiscaviarum TaxID=1823 RepID=A0A516NVQ1_9NOCA|nr:2-oxo-4-hydroxy-4-carboxy-5-ureidoimidazoline decarboxylase [Nocardia otitidiscaviarum]
MTENAIGLEEFAALDETAATELLLTVCASPRWAARVAEGRPFATLDELLRAADAALAELPEDEIDRALAGHPRIGDRPDNAASAREQAGMAGADDRVRAAIVAGNRAYEDRFGHVYLVRASGRTPEELLNILTERLANDPPTERRIVREQLAEINRLRLRHLVDTGRRNAAAATLSTHVLDAVRGRPATGVRVTLFDAAGAESAADTTDADGRITGLGGTLGAGTYRLRFETGEYFAAQAVDSFYPEVTITFTIAEERHYHVPILLSPFAYSTYRGS